MDENSQQPSSEPPPSSAPGPQGAYSMPPASNYPMSSGGGMVSQDDKTQATLMWVLSIFFPLIVPLIFYLISKEKPFVYRHAAMSLTVGIACLIGAIISGILMIILIGFLTYAAVGIYALVVCIMGAMAANKGDNYDPPLLAGLAKNMFKV